MKKNVLILMALVMGIGSFIQAGDKLKQLQSELVIAQAREEALFKTTHFPWGGHLSPCRKAVRVFHMYHSPYSAAGPSGLDGAVQNVIEVCNWNGPQGPGWVSGVFMPWVNARKNVITIQTEIATLKNAIASSI